MSTHVHTHKQPVGSLAGRDGGAGLGGVGGRGACTEAAVRATEGANSLHGHTGVPACLTRTLPFTSGNHRNPQLVR